MRFSIHSFAILFVASIAGLACGQVATRSTIKAETRDTALHDGQHDFDFEIGAWKTHLRRLLHPLTGSHTWVEYDGTTTVHKVWDGRANLVELEVSGPAGHIEALSLRLYNPQSHQWSLNFASSASGTLGQPTIGEFNNGRGEFYDQEMLNGRAIFLRFIISNITPNSCHFEQSFSADGGKTWEVNWIADDTREPEEGTKAIDRMISPPIGPPATTSLPGGSGLAPADPLLIRPAGA